MEKLQFDNKFLYKTGERIIPGSVSQKTLSEHYIRYLFAKKYCNKKIVLNVACGAGYGSEILQSKALEIYNVDISEKLIAYGNLRYGSHRNHFLVMNAQKMTFPDNFFDVIVSFETLEHLRKQKKFLNECHRVLKKEGEMILSMPNKNITSPGLVKPLNNFHFKEWTLAEFENVVANKFKITEIYGQNFTAPVNYKGISISRIYRELSNLLYKNLPSIIFKFVKLNILKYKDVSYKKIKFFSSGAVLPAKRRDFETNKTGKAYSIMLTVLKKKSK